MYRPLDNSMTEALRRDQAPAQETGSVVGFLERGLRASVAEVGSLFYAIGRMGCSHSIIPWPVFSDSLTSGREMGSRMDGHPCFL